MAHLGLWPKGLLIACLLLLGIVLETVLGKVLGTATFTASAQEGVDSVAEQQAVEQQTVEQQTEQALSSAAGLGSDEPDPAVAEASAVDAPVDAPLDQADAVDQTDAQDAVATREPEPILPHDLSPWGMFRQADWVVKAVMIGLVLASITTWTVLVAKTRELRVLVKRQRRTMAVVSEADSLKSAHEQLDEDSTELTRAAARELRLSAKILADTEGVKERVASCLERLEAARGRKITKGTGVLATVGATAPFVGLFGTVWGIMNSFIGISKAQTTNLAVVAPGIAEALLATALGLVAAIPAVVIYNHFARQIAAYRALVGDTSAAILRLVSRDLSRHTVTGLKAVGED